MIDADALFRDLREASDPGRAGPMSSYMRNQFPFLGISATRRRDVCKPHFAGVKKEGRIDWPFVEACWQCEERASSSPWAQTTCGSCAGIWSPATCRG